MMKLTISPGRAVVETSDFHYVIPPGGAPDPMRNTTVPVYLEISDSGDLYTFSLGGMVLTQRDPHFHLLDLRKSGSVQSLQYSSLSEALKAMLTRLPAGDATNALPVLKEVLVPPTPCNWKVVSSSSTLDLWTTTASPTDRDLPLLSVRHVRGGSYDYTVATQDTTVTFSTKTAAAEYVEDTLPTARRIFCQLEELNSLRYPLTMSIQDYRLDWVTLGEDTIIQSDNCVHSEWRKHTYYFHGSWSDHGIKAYTESGNMRPMLHSVLRMAATITGVQQ